MKERKGEGFFNHWLKEKPGRISRSTMTEEATPTHRPSALIRSSEPQFSFAFLSCQTGQTHQFSLCFSTYLSLKAVNVYHFFFILSTLCNKKRKKLDFFWLFCVGFVEIVNCIGVWFIWKKWDWKKRGEGGLFNFMFFSTIGMFGGKNLRWGSLAWFRNLGLSLYFFWLGIVVILNNLANVMWVYLEFFLV